MNRELAVSENSDIDFLPFKTKSFKKLYYTFIRSSSCSLQLQCIDLPLIVPNIKDPEHTLIYLKNIKSTHSIFYKDTLFVFYNNNHIRKYSCLIVITKNIYKSFLKAMNNYLQVVSLPD